MGCVEFALQALQVIAFPLLAPNRNPFGRQRKHGKLRQRRRHLAMTHIGPDDSGALDDPIGLRPHATQGGAGIVHIRQIEAFAVRIELPAMEDATDAVILVPAIEERGAAMGAAMVHDTDLARRGAERDEFLSQQFEANRVAIRDQFRRHQGRHPILPHELAHRRAGPDLSQYPPHLRTIHDPPSCTGVSVP